VKIKTADLTGAALDWAVAKCEGFERNLFRGVVVEPTNGMAGAKPKKWRPSTDWSQGGPIIERKDISTFRCDDEVLTDARGFANGKFRPKWGAKAGDHYGVHEAYCSQGDCFGEVYEIPVDGVSYGPTPLIAGMRCYVASEMGDEVDAPEGLVR
jgi:hypothetical protein